MKALNLPESHRKTRCLEASVFLPRMLSARVRFRFGADLGEANVQASATEGLSLIELCLVPHWGVASGPLSDKSRAVLG